MPYTVQFEISGPAAMFARPDTGSTPISYSIPTWSACKSIFESVARGFFSRGGQPAAIFSATEIEIWQPVRFEKYVTNYRGPLRKSAQMEKNASYQLPSTILVDACFRVTGECIRVPGVADESNNAPHALKEMFERRLAQGRSKYSASLGWKEFVPSYFGPFRDAVRMGADYRLQEDFHEDIPAYLMNMWDAPSQGKYGPVFRPLQIKSGIARLPQVIVRNGKLDVERNHSC
ncbi:MAG: hypothetical protein KF712_09875 [Akkermansiaceae bacterium]|nr:hypothetical protein [Akkermansiaceae bacterium]